MRSAIRNGAPGSAWVNRQISVTRRGTAIALISSGQYIAGVVWPSVFQVGIDTWGWQRSMLVFAGLVLVAIFVLATVDVLYLAGKLAALRVSLSQ